MGLNRPIRVRKYGILWVFFVSAGFVPWISVGDNHRANLNRCVQATHDAFLLKETCVSVSLILDSTQTHEQWTKTCQVIQAVTFLGWWKCKNPGCDCHWVGGRPIVFNINLLCWCLASKVITVSSFPILEIDNQIEPLWFEAGQIPSPKKIGRYPHPSA